MPTSDREQNPPRRFYAISHDDDTTEIKAGSLIPPLTPRSVAHKTSTIQSRVRETVVQPGQGVVMAAVGAGLLAILTWHTGLVPQTSTLLASLTNASGMTDSPIIVESPYTDAVTPLNYGVQGIFMEPTFFADTRDAFIAAEETFIELDLDRLQLRYFVAGLLTAQYPVVSKAPTGSWCETPAGLYTVELKRERHFSTFGQVYQPWSVGFQGNYFLHGVPEFAVDEPVPDEYQGTCIRLSNDDAKALYDEVTVGTPILVYEKLNPVDSFVYQPRIPEIATPHYLIADIESNTILAASEIDSPVPIASITKLMTALVATEYINLDTRVAVRQPSFVQSLVPRLDARTQVSMYSLLQLLLIESSNEAAEVIAAQLGQAEFVRRMNELAANIGMDESTFADTSGLSSDNVSSVRDLFQLTQYIYKHRQFIFDLTADQYLPTVYVSGEFGELQNFNQVADLENFIGGKVGQTNAAGQTSVSLHTINVYDEERTLAIIILGSNQRNQDVRDLLQYAEERFGGVNKMLSDEVVADQVE